jgi:hypothetical protein
MLDVFEYDVTYNLSGTADSLTLLDETVRTEKHNTDLAGFQVHGHALDARGESIPLVVMSMSSRLDINLLDKLLSLDIVQTVDTGNTVTITIVSVKIFIASQHSQS